MHMHARVAQRPRTFGVALAAEPPPERYRTATASALHSISRDEEGAGVGYAVNDVGVTDGIVLGAGVGVGVGE